MRVKLFSVFLITLFFSFIPCHGVEVVVPLHTQYEKILPLQPEEGVFAYSRISPDGNYLSYASEMRVGQSLQRTVNLIDLKKHRILFSEPGIDAYWAPDGERVIYLSTDGGSESVCIWHFKSGKVTRDIAPSLLGHYFTWAWVKGRDLILTQFNRYYYLENERALRPYRRVTACPVVGTGEQPMISRDGHMFATFMDGAVAVRGFEPSDPVIQTYLQGGKADFSWDGRYVAFHVFKNGGKSKGYEIVVVDLQEKKMIRVTDLPGSSYYPSWTKDGRLSFRYDSEDYRGFMMASKFLENPSEPLPQSHERPTGNTVSLGELCRGSKTPSHHVVLVNFWAGWCVHCRDELPVLDKVRRLIHNQNLDAEIIGACEPSSFKSDRDRVVSNEKLSLPQIDIDPKDLASFGVQMFPTNLMFVDGKLIERRYGSQTYDQFIQWFGKQGIAIKL